MDNSTSAKLTATDFKNRWEDFARRPPVPLEYSSGTLATVSCQPLPSHGTWPFVIVHVQVMDLRKLALEFFSWGLRHQAVTQQQLRDLLPLRIDDESGEVAR